MIDRQPTQIPRTAAAGCVMARVRGDGRLAPVDTREGVELIRRLHPLAHYAVAFLRTHLRQTRFIWVDTARSWYAVGLTRERAGRLSMRRPPAATVRMSATAPAWPYPS